MVKGQGVRQMKNTRYFIGVYGANWILFTSKELNNINAKYEKVIEIPKEKYEELLEYTKVEY